MQENELFDLMRRNAALEEKRNILYRTAVMAAKKEIKYANGISPDVALSRCYIPLDQIENIFNFGLALYFSDEAMEKQEEQADEN